MGIPGVTAERGLEQHLGRYAQRSTGRPLERTGVIRPQLPPDWLCDAIFDCCYHGNVGCCWYYVWKC